MLNSCIARRSAGLDTHDRLASRVCARESFDGFTSNLTSALSKSCSCDSAAVAVAVGFACGELAEALGEQRRENEAA